MIEDADIQKLRDYFEKRDDIAMAFLFGSRAEDKVRGWSDWDIAVYFKPKEGHLEYEEYGKEYPQEDKMWMEVCDILKTDKVDLVVLNRAPASIADSAIRGMPLVIKNRGLRLDFMLVITRIAEDFREFTRDYYEIFQRSASLSQKDSERLGRIIEFLENQITLYKSFADMSYGDYEKDLIKRGAVERWVENIINAIADISKIVLSSSKKPSPYGYADSIRSASVYLEIKGDFWDKFLVWIKLRNVLAHEYMDIKWKRIDGFIKESGSHVGLFLEAAKKFLKKNS